MKKGLKIILSVIVVCLIVFFAIWIAKGNDSSDSEIIDFGFKDIGELATEECFTKIVETSKNSKKLFGIEFAKKYFVFSYDATIKAGIDFSKIEVNIDKISKTINVNMPKAEIFDVSIDNDSLEIYVEDNSIFNPISLDDMNNAQKELKAKAIREAKAKGILDLAEKNAKTYIFSFINSVSNLEGYVVVIN